MMPPPIAPAPMDSAAIQGGSGRQPSRPSPLNALRCEMSLCRVPSCTSAGACHDSAADDAVATDSVAAARNPPRFPHNTIALGASSIQFLAPPTRRCLSMMSPTITQASLERPPPTGTFPPLYAPVLVSMSPVRTSRAWLVPSPPGVMVTVYTPSVFLPAADAAALVPSAR